MSSIIVATTPFVGETLPMLQIAHALVERGHAVTVVAGSGFESEVARSGVRFVPLTGAADYDYRRRDDIFPGRAGLRPGLEQLTHDMAHVFGDAIPDQHRILQRLLLENPDQVVVSDNLFLGPWPTALGGPGIRPRRWVVVGCNPLYLSSVDTTPLGPVPVERGADAARANTAANEALVRATRPAHDHLEQVVRDLGAIQPVPTMFDGVVTLPDVFAQLSVPEFEFHRSDAPDTLHFVGLLPVRRPRKWSSPPWWSELDDPRPVVVVTQGTLANRDLTELVEPTLTALAELDVLVVAALGRDVGALSIPEPANAHVESFVPFDALLPRADLLITNGGLGATQHALAAGVPVIVAGLTEDKPAVAARVAAHGLGISLGTARPTAPQIAEATRTVLGSPTIRASVKRISAAYAEYDALDLIERFTQ